MTKETKVTELSDDDLDKVAGAGDPVPYPEISGGATPVDTKEVTLSDSSETSSSANEGGTSKSTVSGVNNSTSGLTTSVNLNVKVQGK